MTYITGVDYAWGQPSDAALNAAGVRFVCRYLCSDRYASKRITREEADRHKRAGRGIVLVWEDTASRMLAGEQGGIADARQADAQCTRFGLPGCPVYLAADWDATPGQQFLINAYLDGAASVIGHARTGLYGGFWVCSRARQAGKAKYFWGTRAWSGINWDACGWKPSIMQGITTTIGGVSCDWDTAHYPDYGQWRGGQAPPEPGWTETIVNNLPTLAQGAGLTKPNEDVRTLQGLLNARHQPVKVDGAFGPATSTAVIRFQSAAGFIGRDIDSIVGPRTWGKLLRR